MDWMNEWCIYIALYCVLLYTQSALKPCGGLLNHHQCAASTWMRSLQECWWISWRTCSQWVGKRNDNLCTVVFLRNSLMPEAILWHTHDQTHTHIHTHTHTWVQIPQSVTAGKTNIDQHKFPFWSRIFYAIQFELDSLKSSKQDCILCMKYAAW